jgi:hypothetical protein
MSEGDVEDSVREAMHRFFPDEMPPSRPPTLAELRIGDTGTRETPSWRGSGADLQLAAGRAGRRRRRIAVALSAAVVVAVAGVIVLVRLPSGSAPTKAAHRVVHATSTTPTSTTPASPTHARLKGAPAQWGPPGLPCGIPVGAVLMGQPWTAARHERVSTGDEISTSLVFKRAVLVRSFTVVMARPGTVASTDTDPSAVDKSLPPSAADPAQQVASASVADVRDQADSQIHLQVPDVPTGTYPILAYVDYRDTANSCASGSTDNATIVFTLGAAEVK